MRNFNFGTMPTSSVQVTMWRAAQILVVKLGKKAALKTIAEMMLAIIEGGKEIC